MRVRLVRVSSNAKTGPIPVSTSDRTTCPSSCVFRNRGCYAEVGPLAWYWRKRLVNDDSATWPKFLADVAALPDATLWRHNQAGDLPHNDGVLDEEKVRELATANTAKRGFTYTHHTVRGSSPEAVHNRGVLKEATAAGFTVNASCESRVAADEAVDNGLLVVLAVHKDAPQKMQTPKGRPVLVCPAQYADVTCSDCRWCAQPNRAFIVAFRAHGASHKQAEAAIAAAEAIPLFPQELP
jgi:hypothetical protein